MELQGLCLFELRNCRQVSRKQNFALKRAVVYDKHFMNHLIFARSKPSLTCREIVMHCWQILQRVPRGDVPCVVQFARYLGAIDQLKEDAGELKGSCPLFLAMKMGMYPK